MMQNYSELQIILIARISEISEISLSMIVFYKWLSQKKAFPFRWIVIAYH